MAQTDSEIWRKLWALFAEPGEFERWIEARIAELQAEEIDAGAECEKLERQLDDLLMKRQQVITWALEGRIAESDMELRLARMALEQSSLERELTEVRLLLGNRAERLIEAARLYREQVRDGAEGINAVPETPEEVLLQFEARRKIVERLVTRVDVLTDKTVKVQTEIDLEAGFLVTLPVSYPLTRPLSLQKPRRATVSAPAIRCRIQAL